MNFPINRTWLALILACLLLSGTPCACKEQSALYPEIEPNRSGHLRVSDMHELYWEVCGNEEGIPVIVLHGGPGAGAYPVMRRFFDPDEFKIILFDQRGANRSRPQGEWRENNTQLLVEDINKLRDHLGVKAKALLFGGSWGTTLALAYAETYPQHVGGMVLRGLFTATKKEIDHFYHGGTALYFPENFEKLKSILPEPDRHDYPRQLFEMTQSEDPAVRKKAINGWAYYEIRLCGLHMSHEDCRNIVNHHDMAPFSILENHYMMHGCFFEDEQLLKNAHKIAEIPTYLVNGRYDVICPPINAYNLAAKLKNVKLEITQAGHTLSEPENEAAMLKGVEWVAARMK